MFQRFECELMFILIAGDCYINPGCAFVVGQPDICNSNCSQTWILELVPNNLSDLFANRVCDSLTTVHRSITTVPGANGDVRRTLVCRPPGVRLAEEGSPLNGRTTN